MTRATATTTATDAGPSGSTLRVVIAHDFAETFGGAERIAATLAETFPDAPFHAILGRHSVAERMGVGDRFSTVLPSRDRILRHYRALAPVFPAVVGASRLPSADVLITSSYAYAHGFRTQNDAPQLCYCYSPLRFAWTMTDEYARQLSPAPWSAALLGAVAWAARRADRAAASHVSRYVAESRFVAGQINDFYGRDAEVLQPPVDTTTFSPPDEEGHDGYFLFCGRLIEPYKRPTLAIEAFRGLPYRLVVAGDGPEYGRLREMAGPNVEFVGQVGDGDLVTLMQRCAAAVFPSRDDFGLIPVEVAACGRPTIAYAAGGALETIDPGRSGEFFAEQSVEALRDAILRFDPDRYDSGAIRSHAEGWSKPRFQERLGQLAEELAAEQAPG